MTINTDIDTDIDTDTDIIQTCKLDKSQETYIAKWDHSKWLVLSSFFFTAPAIYAYRNNLYSYSILLLFTSLISANYWRKATYSWRRNLDLIFAKISFTTFVSRGVIYVTYVPYLLTGYSGMIMLLYCYYLSDKNFKLKNDSWYKYHMLFHFIMMYEMFIILHSILVKHECEYVSFCHV